MLSPASLNYKEIKRASGKIGHHWCRRLEPVPAKAGGIDPLIYPKLKGIMRIIRSIEDQKVILNMLDHLGIWLVRSGPPPKAHAQPIREHAAVDLQIQTHTDTIYNDTYIYLCQALRFVTTFLCGKYFIDIQE